MTKTPLREQIEQLKEAISAEENNNEILTEAMRDLESQLQEQGWQSLFGGMNGRELSKAALNTLYDIARVYWVKNPLIQRAIEVQALYVFAQGMTIKGQHPDVDAVVQKFMKDPKNINALTSHQAWMQNERDLRLSGNQFFALFTNQSTGRVIVRSIPLYEIGEIITNPDDSREPWYYRREYTINELNVQSGVVTPKIAKVYHPDWRYTPAPADRPETIGGDQVKWDTPIMHTKVNCLPDMKYGVCEVYGAIDWSKAYKTHLENGQKLWQALARFAFALTTKGGAGAVAAAKDKIKTLIGKTTSEGAARTTPVPVASVFTSSEGVKLDTVKTSGATIGMDDARRHALMVASATGIPEQILMGDPSTGNLATAKAMERPLELQFINRQKLWMDVWVNLMNYVIDQSIKAENGLLNSEGEGVEDEYTGEINYSLTAIDEKTKLPVPRTVSVSFPPLLEHDILQTVQAIISGATLDGKPLAGTIDMKTLTRLILIALKVENADELIEKYYPTDALIMQTDYAAKSQAAAAAQALALALAQQQRQTPPGQPSDQQPPGNDNQEDPAAADDTQPPGSVQESVATAPLVVENTQAYQETQATLIAARRKFADAILKGLEEHYPESTKA